MAGCGRALPLVRHRSLRNRFPILSTRTRYLPRLPPNPKTLRNRTQEQNLRSSYRSSSIANNRRFSKRADFAFLDILSLSFPDAISSAMCVCVCVSKKTLLDIIRDPIIILHLLNIIISDVSNGDIIIFPFQYSISIDLQTMKKRPCRKKISIIILKIAVLFARVSSSHRAGSGLRESSDQGGASSLPRARHVRDAHARSRAQHVGERGGARHRSTTTTTTRTVVCERAFLRGCTFGSRADDRTHRPPGFDELLVSKTGQTVRSFVRSYIHTYIRTYVAVGLSPHRR